MLLLHCRPPVRRMQGLLLSGHLCCGLTARARNQPSSTWSLVAESQEESSSLQPAAVLAALVLLLLLPLRHIRSYIHTLASPKYYVVNSENVLIGWTASSLSFVVLNGGFLWSHSSCDWLTISVWSNCTNHLPHIRCCSCWLPTANCSKKLCGQRQCRLCRSRSQGLADAFTETSFKHLRSTQQEILCSMVSKPSTHSDFPTFSFSHLPILNKLFSMTPFSW